MVAVPTEPQRKQPGPQPAAERRRQSGYRVTERQRFELHMAGPFVGSDSLQDTVDLAVNEFLKGMRRVSGFVEALDAAEANRRRRAGVPLLREGEEGSSGR